MSSRIDPSRLNIPDDAWEFVEITEDFVTHRAVKERLANGDVEYVYRRAPRGVATLLEANRRSLDESHGKRFGDGKVVASVPLNVMFDPANQIAAKIKEGDRDHLRWWLDRDDARMWRSFRGRLT